MPYRNHNGTILTAELAEVILRDCDRVLSGELAAGPWLYDVLAAELTLFPRKGRQFVPIEIQDGEDTLDELADGDTIDVARKITALPAYFTRTKALWDDR